MPVEQRGRSSPLTWANRVKLGGAQSVSGRRQPSCGDTSRMNREVHVRICEGLGVKFPGPTRQSEKDPLGAYLFRIPPDNGHSPAAPSMAPLRLQKPRACMILEDLSIAYIAAQCIDRAVSRYIHHFED